MRFICVHFQKQSEQDQVPLCALTIKWVRTVAWGMRRNPLREELSATSLFSTSLTNLQMTFTFFQVNGTTACGDDHSLNKILKGELNFQGAVISEWVTYLNTALSFSGLTLSYFAFLSPISWGVVARSFGEKCWQFVRADFLLSFSPLFLSVRRVLC